MVYIINGKCSHLGTMDVEAESIMCLCYIVHGFVFSKFSLLHFKIHGNTENYMFFFISKHPAETMFKTQSVHLNLSQVFL